MRKAAPPSSVRELRRSKTSGNKSQYKNQVPEVRREVLQAEQSSQSTDAESDRVQAAVSVTPEQEEARDSAPPASEEVATPEAQPKEPALEEVAVPEAQPKEPEAVTRQISAILLIIDSCSSVPCF